MATEAQLEEAFIALIAEEVGCRPRQVSAAAALFAEGSTVPFVARYRKEATGGLIDEQLETLARRRDYFLELQSRRDAILASIAEQGKLSDELEAQIRAATTKQDLEDLYLPYKPKRRTRAQIARERGLEPLADALLAAASGAEAPEVLAASFIAEDKEVPDADSALAGARDILAERLSENAEARAHLRSVMARQATFRVRVLSGKEEEEGAAVFRDYFEHDEPLRDVPSHRLLAVLRGEREGFLLSEVALDDEAEIEALAQRWQVPLGTPCGRQVRAATEDGYQRLLRPSIANQVRGEIREKAEAEAISVFRANLEALLMQAPLGQLPVMGLDPGYRTGCKVAVVDPTGRVLDTAIIYPVPPKAREQEAAAVLLAFLARYKAHAVAIGNGTGSRETEAFARTTIREAGVEGVTVAIVPETGASVYSASAEARNELPDLDVSLRGAVSIARRLQDPLAEFVKIEPRSLGVGQYQHDVDQKALARELDTAVEVVVNRVGVELNSASASLLRRVSGLSERLARAIVAHRDARGPFASRKALLEVAGFGPKTFEQAAGFLRLRDAAHALDRTAVHPERYTVVEAMARELDLAVEALVGNRQEVSRIDFSRFADESAGLGAFTLADIEKELLSPGRDPRPEFEVPEWREDVRKVEDLQPGMVIEGRVSNVTNFGAFVDIGVGRDGLVHLSELSHRWIEDPREAVQVGQVVKAMVKDVDRERNRIGLSIKALIPEPAAGSPGGGRQAGGQKARRGDGPARAAKGGGQKGEDRQGGGRSAPRPPARPSPPPKGPATLDDLMSKYNRRS